MALTFLYVAFVRVLQLLGLRRSEQDDLAIEVAKWPTEVKHESHTRAWNVLSKVNRLGECREWTWHHRPVSKMYVAQLFVVGARGGCRTWGG
jgi:hypothetical protein